MKPGIAAPPAQEEPGKAIGVICLGVFLLVLNDSCAKWLTEHYPVFQILFLRGLVSLPVIIFLLWRFGGGWQAFHTKHLGLHAIRGVLLLAAAFTFFSGLVYLPIAEATCLVFAAPLLITALSVPLLGEHVGWRRWTSVLVGFVGVLIVVRPGADTFQLAALFPLATAVLYALLMISSRWIRSEESIWNLLFFLVLFPFIYGAPFAFWVWQPFQWEHLPIVLAQSFFGNMGMVLISQSFRMAPASVVAPFDYTALVWATLLGWLIWGELPDGWTYAGAAVIIASGIYIVLRDGRKKAAQA